MKYFSEKEKKLEIALDKLKKLNLLDEEGQKNLEFLSNQKNQLEIEKKELQNKHSDLQLKIIKDKNSKHKLDQLKFNEKIDELNQETDILLEEIDKWQM